MTQDNLERIVNERKSELIRLSAIKKIDTEVYLDTDLNFSYDINITKKGKLILAPGIKLTFDENCGLLCHGQLIAEGTSDKMITFTGDGWKNIRFRNDDDKSVMKYCLVEKGNSDYGFVVNKNGSKGSRTETGGGISVCHAIIDLENCRIENNIARLGGGIAFIQSEIHFQNNTVKGNKSKIRFSEGRGGGIYIESCTGILWNNEIIDNMSTWVGGGIDISGSTMDIGYNIIEKNKSTRGGGIGLWKSILRANNNTIEYNEGHEERTEDNFFFESGYGGGIYLQESKIYGDENSIIGNKAHQGGGVYMEASDFLGKNNMVKENMTYSHKPWNKYLTAEENRKKGGIYMEKADTYTKPSHNNCIKKDNAPE